MVGLEKQNGQNNALTCGSNVNLHSIHIHREGA